MTDELSQFVYTARGWYWIMTCLSLLRYPGDQEMFLEKASYDANQVLLRSKPASPDSWVLEGALKAVEFFEKGKTTIQ